jgi:hypothetical protein
MTQLPTGAPLASHAADQACISDRVVVLATGGMAHWAEVDPVPEHVAGHWPPGS